jgi:hypothetical protein
MAASCNTETSIIVATPTVMVFPYNEAVTNATHKKKKKAASKGKSSTSGSRNSKGAATTTCSSTPLSTSSR